MLMNLWLRVVLLGGLVWLLTGCSSKGGEQSSVFPVVDETPASPEPKVFTIEGPEQSELLQSTLEQLQPGDTVIIKSGNGVYRGHHLYPGELLRGFTLVNSGTAQAPIRIIGESSGSGDRPVIDQGRGNMSNDDSGEPVVGLYLPCVSHVVIENIEIRYADLAGISSSLHRCKSENIKIQNSYIHHIYGDRNVAGIRLSRVSNVLVKNNIIHDVFKTESDEDTVLIEGEGAEFVDITITNNDFSAINTGVRIHAQNNKSVKRLQVANNRFRQLETGLAVVIDANNSSPGDLSQVEPSLADASVSAVDVHDNVFYELNTGIDIDVDNSQQQSQAVAIYNNTFSQLAGPALSFAAVSGLGFYNNILNQLQRDAVLSITPVNTALQNSIEIFDYNLYWHKDYTAAGGPEWLLDVGGGNEHTFGSLQDWQTAYSRLTPAQLRADPDQASQFTNPYFVDEANVDFTPQAPFALGGGRNGEGLGAYRNGLKPGLL